jgi:hypothetical protein
MGGLESAHRTQLCPTAWGLRAVVWPPAQEEEEKDWVSSQPVSATGHGPPEGPRQSARVPGLMLFL